MLYSATGNAYAQLGRQPGKDLWTASSFALDADTGALKWYWQEAHHDNWDLDHGGASILMNLKINGKALPGVPHAATRSGTARCSTAGTGARCRTSR